jgi:pyridoxine kinase
MKKSALMQIVTAPRVLSIQSHTVHGFVGNKAATFPLQSMGFDVDCINTVSLSNHPAYAKTCKGASLDSDAYAQLIDGLAENQLLRYDVVLTGYTRSASHLATTADAVAAIRAVNPEMIYLCDPVLGDNGAYYVPPELMEQYKTKLLPLATAITPNFFECQVLSGIDIHTMQDAVRACEVLHGFGPELVVMTGLQIAHAHETPHLAALLSRRGHVPTLYPQNDAQSAANLYTNNENKKGNEDKESKEETSIYRVDIPKIDRVFAGCGDLFAALTAAGLYFVRGVPHARQPAILGSVLEISAHAMQEVLQHTQELNSRELCIVESRDTYIHAAGSFQQAAAAAAAAAAAVHFTSVSTTNDDDDDINDEGKMSSVPALTGMVPAHLVHHSRSSSCRSRATGVIFDMDGTLTAPGAIDFDAMYRRIGLTREANTDILTLIGRLGTDEDKARALQIVFDEEMNGCARQSIRPGLHTLISSLKQHKLRMALCTRNCRDAYVQFLDKASLDSSVFQPVLCRDSLHGLNKPDPAVAQHILEKWDVLHSESTYFVGDSMDDMHCGKRAGCRTVLILTEFNQGLSEKHPEVIDHVINSLEELILVLGLS